MKRTCEHCRYAEAGRCHRNPPVVYPAVVGFGPACAFPQVRPDDQAASKIVGLIALLLAVGIGGCDRSTAFRVRSVTMDDGRTVQCAVSTGIYYSAAIDCDWEHAQ